MVQSFRLYHYLCADCTPSEPSKTDPPTLIDENEASEDDPDPNLVPLDTEGPPPEAADQNAPTTSAVPRAEDLLQPNPTGNSPATVRFSDALNPPAELTQTQDPSGNAADQTEYASYNVPIVMDPSVQAHIRYFNTAIHDRFGQWLLRLSRYRPIVETIFSEFHLPSDLVYLSLVESGFNPYAYSRAKATGPWQFMKGTAKSTASVWMPMSTSAETPSSPRSPRHAISAISTISSVPGRSRWRHIMPAKARR